MGGAPEMEDDATSYVSERTGSVLSVRGDSDTGGLEAGDAPSDPRPGTDKG